ncbi:MAG TPA: hypothetical protein VJK26_02650 [Patescibacteria group bacterium]|nr:hypothetical protein [Patescibacteria group bacterium]
MSEGIRMKIYGYNKTESTLRPHAIITDENNKKEKVVLTALSDEEVDARAKEWLKIRN